MYCWAEMFVLCYRTDYCRSFFTVALSHERVETQCVEIMLRMEIENDIIDAIIYRDRENQYSFDLDFEDCKKQTECESSKNIVQCYIDLFRIRHNKEQNVSIICRI